MRLYGLALVLLSGCDKLFSLEAVDDPLRDADAIDAVSPDAAEPQLGKWTMTTSLPADRDYNHPHSAAIGDTVYLIGGFDVATGTETAVVYRATATGPSLGPWTTTAPLPAPRALGDVVTVGSRIYVVGGANLSGAQSTVYVAEPDGTGSIPSWSAATPLPEPRKAHAIASVANHIYVVGGADTANVRQTTVFHALVQQTGGLGAWQETAPLPAIRANLGVVAVGNSLYAIGGDDDAGTPYDTVYVAAIDPATGELAPWTATTSLPAPRKAYVALSDGSHIYVIGGAGQSATSEVSYSEVAADGALGPWAPTEPLLFPRYRHSGVIANGNLFVLGGALAASSVEVATQGP